MATDEYIEKNALYKKIAELEKLARDRYLDVQSNSPAYTRYMAQLDELIRLKHMVYDFPSADVAPVKHGKWVYDPETVNTLSRTKCNCCGWWSLDLSIRGVYHYCPNCGAKMDLEEDAE